jgi:hypothetical protein
MEYAISSVPAAPVRKEASHRTEMVNQLLFGETMQVLEVKEEWLRVRSLYDDYEGWVTDHLVTDINKDTALLSTRYFSTGLVNPVTLHDQLIQVPFGSSLTGFDEETRLLWDDRYKYQGSYWDSTRSFNLDMLRNTALPWLNAPYLWGGKTFMGVDCSGFVQTIYKILGIRLKRDAWQQEEQGEKVDGPAAMKEGDLAFFCNEKGRVTHVGIVLEGERIIHASGKVRIDHLDASGILNRENGKRTHSLHSIKRYF